MRSRRLRTASIDHSPIVDVEFDVVHIQLPLTARRTETH